MGRGKSKDGREGRGKYFKHTSSQLVWLKMIRIVGQDKSTTV